VIDEKNILRGIVTQRDLYRIISPIKDEEGETFYNKEALDKYILKYTMTKKLTTLKADDTLAAAVGIMAKNKYGCIPIIDDGNHLIGIVTQMDVLKKIANYI